MSEHLLQVILQLPQHGFQLRYFLLQVAWRVTATERGSDIRPITRHGPFHICDGKKCTGDGADHDIFKSHGTMIPSVHGQFFVAWFKKKRLGKKSNWCLLNNSLNWNVAHLDKGKPECFHRSDFTNIATPLPPPSFYHYNCMWAKDEGFACADGNWSPPFPSALLHCGWKRHFCQEDV